MSADLADAVRSVADAIRPQPERIGHQSQPVRVHAAMLARNPFWLEQWQRAVPAEFLSYDPDADLVTVRCHEPVTLERNELADCPAACGRWFWRLPHLPMVEGVRVARWEAEAA